MAAHFANVLSSHPLAVLAGLRPSRKAIGRLLHCARVIGGAGAAGVALAAVDTWAGKAAALPESLRTVIADLRSSFEAPQEVADEDKGAGDVPAELPDDWLAWARWVADGAPPALARRRLEERAATWSVEPLGAAPGAEELAQHLGNAGVSAGDVTQAAFPHLFEAFVVAPRSPSPPGGSSTPLF